jgi:hypothetical protein
MTQLRNYKTDTVASAIMDKLNHSFAVGKDGFVGGTTDIMNEFGVRQDVLAPSNAIHYHVQDSGALSFAVADNPVEYTGHALGQLLERIGMTKRFYDSLMDKPADKAPWSRELVQHNLRTLTDKNLNGDRLLFRIVNGLVKGTLSESYRRIDFAPIAEEFVQTALALGFKPFGCKNTDTRYSLKMVHPQCYAISDTEVVVFGMELTSSDYGRGKFSLAIFIDRIMCTNLSALKSLHDAIHLGSRLGNGSDTKKAEILFSQNTHDLDTQTIRSAIKDILTGNVFEQKAIEYCGIIDKAIGDDVSKDKANEVFKGLQRKGSLNKAEVEKANMLYNDVQEIAYLPKEKSAWRLSNVLSFMAQNPELKGDKALDLERTAGQLIEA